MRVRKRQPPQLPEELRTETTEAADRFLQTVYSYHDLHEEIREQNKYLKSELTDERKRHDKDVKWYRDLIKWLIGILVGLAGGLGYALLKLLGGA